MSAPDFLTHDFVEGSYEVASQELRAKNPFAPLQRNKKIGRRHEADFCSDIDFSSMMLSSSLLVLLSRPETRRLLSRLSRTGTASLRNWTAIGRKSHESDTQRHPRWIFYAAILCGYSLGVFRAERRLTSSKKSAQSIQPFIPDERELTQITDSNTGATFPIARVA